MIRGVPGKTIIRTTDPSITAFRLGPGAVGSGMDSSGFLEDIIFEGPGDRPTTLSVGLFLDGLRFFSVRGVTARKFDVGFDLLNNCYGTEFYKCKTLFGSTNVGIRLRGQQPDGTWGSGSDITLANCWFHGNLAGYWIEKDGGGYHFIRGQVSAGHNLAADTDIAGAIVMGANYEDPTNAAFYGDAGNVSVYGVDVEGFKRCYAIRSFGRINFMSFGSSYLATSATNVAMGVIKATGAENGTALFAGSTIKGTYSQDLASIAGNGSAFYFQEENTLLQATVKSVSVTPGATMGSQSNLALGVTLGRTANLPYIGLGRARVRQAANASSKFEASVNNGTAYDVVFATIVYGTAAPTTTPTFAGQVFVDTTGKKAYMAIGTTAAADWVQISN
ncbi:hypothetical protein D3C74_230080 [compost metagenome]